MLQEGPEKATRSHEELQVALFDHRAPQQFMRGHGEPRGVVGLGSGLGLRVRD